MNKEIVRAENVNFYYDQKLILESINCTILSGEFIGILGPNGAGKSTFLKLLLGLLKPDTGTISVLGTTPEEARVGVGYVPQHAFFDPAFPITVLDVVKMGLLSKKKLFRPFNRQDRQKALDALEQVGMLEYKSTQIGELSGGQRQRTFLARALITDAQLLVLDEPLASIDAPRGMEFYQLLQQLNQKMTIILVTHDIGVVPNYVSKIFCLNRKLYCHDSKEEALSNLEQVYGCPVDLVAHGVPHRVIGEHKKKK